MRGASTLLGVALAAGLAAGYPVMLGSVSHPHDLVVDHRSDRPYELRTSPNADRSHLQIGPEEVTARIEESFFPKADTQGLLLRTWSVSYGNRWLREVTLPELVGPFVAEREEVCGYNVWLGAGLFDTTGAGAGLKALVDRKLVEQFPLTVTEQGITIRFAQVRRTDVSVQLGVGYAVLYGDITLDDGHEEAPREIDRPTRFRVSIKVRLVAEEGAPRLMRAERIRLVWEGHTKAKLLDDAAEKGAVDGGLLGALIGLFIAGPPGALIFGGAGAGVGAGAGEETAEVDGQKVAEGKVTERVDDALRSLALGLKTLREPWAPLSNRPDAHVTLRLSENPTVTTAGIRLPLCVGARVRRNKTDPLVAGPPKLDVPPSSAANRGDASANIAVHLDGNAINQILWFLWQTGTLREWGRSSALLDQLPDELEKLAFDVSGFDPGLPPTVMAHLPQGTNDALTTMLANVQLGSWGSRTVVGHAATKLSVRSERDAIILRGEVDYLGVNCFELTSANRTQLTPCLSDLLPMARDELARTDLSYSLDGGQLLGRLPELAFQGGLRVRLSNLAAKTLSKPVGLEVGVQARLEAMP